MIFQGTEEVREKVLADDTFLTSMTTLLADESFQGLIIQRLFNENGVKVEIKNLLKALNMAIRQAETIMDEDG